jgi:hypothetical protein
LLKNLLHVVRFVQVARIVLAVRLLCLSQVEHFFLTGADPQVNENGPNSGTPVTVVTMWEELSKKELAFTQNRPKLRVSPKTRSRVQRAVGFRKYVHSWGRQPASYFSGTFSLLSISAGFSP